jgi:hypothetical protein
LKLISNPLDRGAIEHRRYEHCHLAHFLTLAVQYVVRQWVNNEFVISNQIIDQFVEVLKEWKVVFEAYPIINNLT